MGFTMIVDRNISPFVVIEHESILEALKKIDANEDGMVICTDESGLLLGVLTDGDFRRWVMKGSTPDLNQPVGKIINRVFEFARIGDSAERISGRISKSIVFLPLVDSQGRFIALARARKAQFQIAERKIGPSHACFVIAEIGNNHNGSIELACRLVDEAIGAGADCAKFQLRDMTALYANSGNANDVSEDLGSQYTLDLLSRVQLSRDDLFRVFDYCVKKGIVPLCTPWDVPSFMALDAYGISGYKVASADFTNHDFLRQLISAGKPLICSTGMTTESDIGESIALLRSSGAQYALLHCNSTYPAPFKDLNLRYMGKLRELGECAVGYSSHDRGINIAVAAVTLGANIIEKHFTLDREMEGNDHRVSLLPSEFSAMVEGIRQVESALEGSTIRRPSQGEVMNRETLGKSLWINVALKPGEIIAEHMLDVRSPGRGLQPNRKSALVGKPARRAFKPGDILYPSDLGEDSSMPRRYSFKRPFGIPVRYHDLHTLGSASNFDLLEFHLSYQDLQEDIEKYLVDPLDIDLVVHSPELFAGDHIMDLCSPSAAYRILSIENLRKVVEITRKLREKFTRSERPRLIINAGGFSMDKPLDGFERKQRYEMILESLSKIDLEGVEVIPQTMPPFPWHFGGQRFHNLFIDPDETTDFCIRNGFRVCLDVSHSKLACNFQKWSFTAFIEKVGPHSAHLHIADASGIDGEGLQIDEGEIDLVAMGRSLAKSAPGVSFIPEIWQGHKNHGEGFWKALDRLESHL
jgi:sialic acid synthase SpsE/sugar phosphate isomerase/epimerase